MRLPIPASMGKSLKLHLGGHVQRRDRTRPHGAKTPSKTGASRSLLRTGACSGIKAFCAPSKTGARVLVRSILPKSIRWAMGTLSPKSQNRSHEIQNLQRYLLGSKSWHHHCCRYQGDHVTLLKQRIKPVVAVQPAVFIGHLQEPGPDVVWWRIDGDRLSR
jgi:hypothetical protein